MRMLIAGIAALMMSTVSLSSAAQTDMVVTGSAPGMVSAAESVLLQGSITAIDNATRKVTLKGEAGNELVVNAGPEVANFDQLRIGDVVALELMHALTLELKKGSTAIVSRSDAIGGARAADGATPAGVLGREIKVMAEVTAVDAERHSVTVQGPEHSIELPIADPAQFALISVGDRIEATYIEAVAISVTHVGKAESKD